MKRSPTTPRAEDAALDDAELAARLRLSVTRLARRLRQQSDVEATASQISALATIERLGPLTIGELSAAERVQPPSMTRIVAGLEELDLIQRETDEHDRRVARVRVTPLGQRLLERSRSKKNAYLAARLRAMGRDERATLAHAADILERMLESGE
jgi:DNA-binding MarR family transcriptional regulator